MENNTSKDKKYLLLLLMPFIFTILLTFVVVYENVHMFQKIFSTNIVAYKNDYMQIKKQEAQMRVDNIINYIKNIKTSFPNLKNSELKKLTLKWIKENQEKSQYIFVYKLLNPEGGDKFAKMLVNPNRKDLVGKLLSSNHTDIKGIKYREIMLNNVLQNGDTFVTYFYKDPKTEEISKKTSYFKYYKNLHWIVATGIYYDSMDAILIKYEQKVFQELKVAFKEMILVITILILLSIIFLLFVVSKLKVSMDNKNYKIEKHQKILKEISRLQNELIKSSSIETLEVFIKKELNKIANILEIDRIYIFQNHFQDDDLYCSQILEYSSENIKLKTDNSKFKNISYDEINSEWKKIFLEKEKIFGVVRKLPNSQRKIFEDRGALSVLIEPIYFQNQFWGFIGFDDCKKERIWDEIDEFSLISLSNSIVSILEREEYIKKLHLDLEEIIKLESEKRELVDSLQEEVAKQVEEIRRKDNILAQQSKMASMGEMIANIAHQWRQPLNVLSTSVINISLKKELEELSDEDLDNCINQNQKVIQDMSQTIDDFRDFFSPDKKKEEFNVQNVVNESSEFIKAALRNNNIKLEIISEKECSIFGYKNNLKQVILVMLNNAKDAIKSNKIEDGRIFIFLNCDENNLILKIRDNALGIPEEIKDKIFEPYFTTKHKSQGTGIGLYMVMEIISKHFKGSVEVENVEYEYNKKLEKGAEFTIRIPLKSE